MHVIFTFSQTSVAALRPLYLPQGIPETPCPAAGAVKSIKTILCVPRFRDAGIPEISNGFRGVAGPNARTFLPYSAWQVRNACHINVPFFLMTKIPDLPDCNWRYFD